MHLLKRWLSDPLAGFLLAGGSLFLLQGFFTDEPVTRVVVSGDDVQRLVVARQEVLGRSLTGQEKRSLRETYIDNEVLVREAVALGLHLEDFRIRQRLAEKMYYLFDRDIPEPTAEQLAQYYADHRDKYLTPPTISFEHHYFKDSKAAADAAFELLSQGREAGGAGRRILAWPYAGRLLCRTNCASVRTGFRRLPERVPNRCLAGAGQVRPRLAPGKGGIKKRSQAAGLRGNRVEGEKKLAR